MRKHKTLWEKLSQKHKGLVEAEMFKYPNSTRKLIDELKSNYGSTYMTVDKAMSLSMII
ncbi:MAG: hypothetical protein IMY67_11670, partial [Bacteroidetes bacterium]|nr:hypothetical protein [Bacteroidota bacterium]